MKCIYQYDDWPNFEWEADLILELLAEVRNLQGVLSGKMDAIGFDLQKEAYLETLSLDVIKSSEIEGELLDTAQVRSSIASKLGIDIGGMVTSQRDVDGVVEMMIDATQNWSMELNEERLFGWHASLFPAGRSGMYKIITGDWRNDSTGPMQVISGAMGKEKVHYQAPKARVVGKEMSKFLNWINQKSNNDPVINAAVAHLWFVTIHPFEDGNGRIARAITDFMLCRAERRAQRFYSMSSQIMEEKKEYYDILENTQKGTLNITLYIKWFLSCLKRSIDRSSVVVDKIMTKHQFWNDNKGTVFNERQIKIIELLFGDFFGKLTTTKWARINKCSQDTALRDIQDLIEKRIMKKSESGGRSTNYELIIPTANQAY